MSDIGNGLMQLAAWTRGSVQRLDQLLALQGRVAAMQVGARETIHTLADVEFRVASQWGEDGIIEWLCHKLPAISRSFIEFGVESFTEANCRFLMENRGWRGLVMDGDAAAMANLRHDALYWRQDLTAVGAFVTAENINTLIADNGFAGEVGILSVDIDGNDYWVLQAIDCVNPAIIICEVNGIFGDVQPVTIPYQPGFQRLAGHYSGQYFGCSVMAAQQLCAQKGYAFIGTNSNGVNAFFVRNDLAAPILAAIAEIKVWAPRHRDSRTPTGQLSFARGLARYELIADQPVVDVRSGRVAALRDLQPLYSDTFLRDFR